MDDKTDALIDTKSENVSTRRLLYVEEYNDDDSTSDTKQNQDQAITIGDDTDCSTNYSKRTNPKCNDIESPSSSQSQNNEDNNEDCSKSNKSHGSKSNKSSETKKSQDDLYEGFVTNRRHSMSHFLEDDISLEEDTKRPWRQWTYTESTVTNEDDSFDCMDVITTTDASSVDILTATDASHISLAKRALKTCYLDDDTTHKILVSIKECSNASCGDNVDFKSNRDSSHSDSVDDDLCNSSSDDASSRLHNTSINHSAVSTTDTHSRIERQSSKTICESMIRHLNDDQSYHIDCSIKSDLADHQSQYSVNSIPSAPNTPAVSFNKKRLTGLCIVVIFIGLCLLTSYLISSNRESTQLPNTAMSVKENHLLLNLLHENNASTFALSSDGNVLVYDDESAFHIYNITQNHTQNVPYAVVSYSTSKLSISNNGTCFIRLAKKSSLSLLTVFLYSSGVWTAHYKHFDSVVESMSISHNCQMVAIGIPNGLINGQNSGYAMVYEILNQENSISFKQIGQTITGYPGYHTGYDISLSKDGAILAISSPNANINGNDSGQVIIYKLTSSTWRKIFDVLGASEGDLLGTSISLSSSGHRIAIASKGSSSSFGQVQVFEYNESWVKCGTTLVGEMENDIITLSGNGDRLIIPFQSCDVYEWDDKDWDSVGYLPSPTTSLVKIDSLGFDYGGDRLVIGGDGFVSLYEFEQVIE